MAQTIYTNIPSLTAQRNLNNTQELMNTSLARLSSGLRVNSAKDDAAGLAIAERMDAQVRGMSVAMRNANDAISFAQVAEGGYEEIGNMMQRMRELAVQAANGTNSTSDLANLDAEFQALETEITRIAEVTQFNGQAIIGADVGTFSFQVGANNTANEQIDITTTALASTIGDVTTSANAQTAIDELDTAIDEVTGLRAELGATQSQFSSAVRNLQVGMENQAAARSRIMDADFAVETSNMTRASILQQAGVSMVAQANAQPQSVLSLLG